MISELNVWTLISRPPYQYFIVVTLVATLRTTNAHFAVLVVWFFHFG
jgi:hypothetical protein